MRGRRETRRAPVPILVAGLALGLALPAAGGADPAQQAKALRARQTILAGRSHAALLSLYSLDARLAAARSGLTSLRERLTALRAQQAEAAREQTIAKEAWRKSVLELGTHLRALYEQSQPDALSVVLGATSVDDAVTRLDALQRSAQLDRHAIAEALASERSLVELRRRLAAASAQLQALASAATATASSLEQVRAQRAAYIAALRRHRLMNAHQITRLEASAHSIAARSQAIAAAHPPAPAAPLSPSAPASAVAQAAAQAGGVQITVTATGYSLGGRTATGMPVGWGVIAVDPAVIPLGTRMTIPGYGQGVAADTGGAVHGATIDLWFPTLAQAFGWGRRTVTVTLH